MKRALLCLSLVATKAGERECDECGCWALVTQIADGIEHADHRAPSAPSEGG